jgi:YjbE family integral membrane protein
MPEFLLNINWSAVMQIIMIDILLGGDNAVVIALACRNLPEQQRVKGIVWGTAGAIILRIILISFAVTLLKMPFLKMIGGLLLLWIGIKLMAQGDDDHGDIKTSDKLWAAVKTIIIADFVMSLDNVVGVAGAAEHAPADQQLTLIIFGLLVSIPLIVSGSRLVLALLERFPIVITLGAALLGWIAGTLIISDQAISGYFSSIHHIERLAGLICALVVVGIGKMKR